MPVLTPVTREDVATYLKASRSWVYLHAEDGTLPCVRIGGLLRFLPDQIRAYARGESVPKFVYLDMEEYRDKELTAEAFMRTLDRPGLGHVRAGLSRPASRREAPMRVGYFTMPLHPPGRNAWRRYS